MIPRAIWISTAMLLLGMSVRPAKADPTVILNARNDATEIDNLVIGTSTYDVTFGANADTTFDTEALSNKASRRNRYCLERCHQRPLSMDGGGEKHFRRVLLLSWIRNL